MKTFFRNILIILFYLTSIPFWRRVFLCRPMVRVWCLHEVKTDQINQFEQKLLYLKEKYNIISPAQFINQDFSKNKLNILITFDDGYDNWLTNVLPILKKQGIKAIFFINNYFEKYSKELLADGHSLGGHGVSHAYLTKLSDEKLKKEVGGSIKSEFFAYPEGDRHSYNDEVIFELKRTGYQYAFTILPGFNNKKTDPYKLHRDSLDPDINNLTFKLWFKGSYDFKK